MNRKATNRLRVIRADRQVTQMDLARKTGIGLSRYWRIEHGYDKPKAREVEKLAKALQVEAADLGLAVSA